MGLQNGLQAGVQKVGHRRCAAFGHIHMHQHLFAGAQQVAAARVVHAVNHVDAPWVQVQQLQCQAQRLALRGFFDIVDMGLRRVQRMAALVAV